MPHAVLRPGAALSARLFSGGTLAYEAQAILQDYLPGVHANAPLRKELKLANALVSEGHTIVDLGEDEFTVGRLHPMMDNELRIRRLGQEAADPETARESCSMSSWVTARIPIRLASSRPAIAQARDKAAAVGRHLMVVAVVTGTDQDPQGLQQQIDQLTSAGAWVETSNAAMVRHAGQVLRDLERAATSAGGTDHATRPASCLSI